VKVLINYTLNVNKFFKGVLFLKTKKVDKKLLNTFKAEEPTIQELRNIAKNLGIKLKRNMKKKEILKLILKEIEKIEKSLEIDSYKQEIATTKKYPQEKKQIFELSQGEPPKTYNKDKIKLIPVNPRWVYTYWDFSEKTKERLKKLNKSELSLRLTEVPTEKEIKKEDVFEEKIILDTISDYFFHVPRENSTYVAQIGTSDENGSFKTLLESNKVTTPSSSEKQFEKEKWLRLKGKEIIVEEKESKHTEEKYTQLTKVSSKININNRRLLFPFISDGGSQNVPNQR